MTSAGCGTVLVRCARAEGANAIGRIQSECWRATYPCLVPDAVLLRMTPERQARLWSRYLGDRRNPMGAIYVVDADDAGVLGFGSCGPEQTGRIATYDGEVYTLYMADGARGRGYGQRLMHAMFARLAADGCRAAADRKSTRLNSSH